MVQCYSRMSYGGVLRKSNNWRRHMIMFVMFKSISGNFIYRLLSSWRHWLLSNQMAARCLLHELRCNVAWYRDDIVTVEMTICRLLIAWRHHSWCLTYDFISASFRRDHVHVEPALGFIDVIYCAIIAVPLERFPSKTIATNIIAKGWWCSCQRTSASRDVTATSQ